MMNFFYLSMIDLLSPSFWSTFIAACPCVHHPDWGDKFFKMWEPLVIVHFFTDEGKTDWSKACGVEKHWNDS
jgi:hypothetical protein